MAFVLAASTAAWAQTAIPASFAHPRASANAATRGFTVRVVQAVNTAGGLANSIARAESQLAGSLINPLTGTPFANVADLTAFNPDGTYNEPAAIDYEKRGGASGPIPGITTDSTLNQDNIALDAVAYLDLDPGTYSMIVNSDDGFRVTVGPDARDQASAIELGKFDGGRGADDSVFGFTVSAAGVYSFRLVWEQGGGDANVSWFTAPPGDPASRVLVNADGGVKAYRSISGAVAPYVTLARPRSGAQNVTPSTTVDFAIVDGNPAKVNASTVNIYFDDVKTPAVAAKTGSKTTVSFKPTELLAALSEHKVKLTFNDDSTPVNSRTNEYTFKVASYANIKLPAPIYLENFESTAEGDVPAGWSQVNFTDRPTGILDLDDPNSDSFLGWLVISSNRVYTIGEGAVPVADGGPGPLWEGIRRLSLPEQYVNGVKLTSLVKGNFAYAESDQRGGSQVQYLFSKDYDLTGKTDIYLSYNSMYEQNQDSMGSVEYSINGGTTWLPVVIMIDGADAVKDANGKILGYETLIADQGDTAHYEDPVNGASGGYYGAFLGNQDTNTWKDLGPFISERVNDDSIESKRVELFRLPKADNQKTVRLRFAQAGTGSWYFGVDDVGFYSITAVEKPSFTGQPASASRIAGLGVTFKAAATGIGVTYQWKHGVNPIPGATASSYSIAHVTADDAGDYSVVATNAGGAVPSQTATLTVRTSPEPIDVNGSLVAHLKFDDNYTDASGHSVDGSAQGTKNTPAFEAGVIGKGVHITNKKDGSLDAYVSLGYPSVLKFGDELTGTDFTISFWVKLLGQMDDQPYISNKDWGSSNNRGWGIFSQGGGIMRVNLTGSSGKFSDKPGGGALSDAAWHLVTVAVSRTKTVDSYVDGVLSLSDPIVTKGTIDTDDDTSKAVNIGQDGTGFYTDGGSSEIDMVVDDLGIWRRAITADEAAVIYLRGIAGKSLDQGGSAPVVVSVVPAGGALNPDGVLTNVVKDEGTKTITADLPTNQSKAAYLQITPPVTIKTVHIVGGKLVITYQ